MTYCSNKNTEKFVIKNWLLFTLCISLFILAFYGTVQSAWWEISPWTKNSFKDDFFIVIAISFITNLLFLSLRFRFFTLLSIPIAIYVGIAGLGSLAAVIWLWVCSTLIGAFISSLIGTQVNSIANLRNAAIGFASLGLIISILAHFPFNFPVIYFALFSLLAIASKFKLSKNTLSVWCQFPTSVRPKRPWSENILSAICLTSVAITAVITAIPDIGHDALSMHLNIAARMLESGIWHFDVTEYIWAVMPFGADWLYVPSYFLAGEQGVKLLNSSFLLAVALASYQILIPRVGATFAYIAPALLLTLPLSYLEVGTTFIEVPLAFFFLFCLFEIINPTHQNKGTWLSLAIIAGYACSMKLIAVLIIPFLIIGAYGRARLGKFEPISLRTITSATVVFSLFSLSPYLIAFFKTGNPLFPFFNSVFLSPYYSTSDFTNPLYKMDIGFKTFWDMSINSKNFGEFDKNGALGITFLILTPMSIATAVFHRRWWILACLCSIFAYGFVVFHNQAYLRYVFPILPWLLLIGAWAISRLPFARISGTIAICILCVINISRFPVAYYPLQSFDLLLMGDKNVLIDFIRQSKPELIVGNFLSDTKSYEKKKILLLGIDPVFSNFPDGTIADSWHSWPYFSHATSDKNIIDSIARAEAELIVHTVGRGYPHEMEITNATDEQFRVRDIRVGLIKPDLIFTKEHIKGSDLGIDNGASWQLNGAQIVPGGIRVNGNTPIVQQVMLYPNKPTSPVFQQTKFIKIPMAIERQFNRVFLAMRVTCPIGGSFRSQINWSDVDNKFISVDIKIHPCDPRGSNMQRTILVPSNANTAIVYGVSSDDKYVEINKISLRTTK